MQYQAYQGVQVEVTAPSAALVVGFPLLLMLVMLLMNAVERRLTGPGRSASPVRVVSDGRAEDTIAGAAQAALAPPTTAAAPVPAVAPPASAVATGPMAAEAAVAVGDPAAAGHRRALRLTAADLVPADPARVFTHAALAAAATGPHSVVARAAEAGILPTRAEAL